MTPDRGSRIRPAHGWAVLLLLLLGAGCPTRTQWVATRLDGGADAAAEGCPDGQISCDEHCVDTSTDPEHCGGCGNACAPLQECQASGCVCAQGTEPCGGSCRDTTVDPQHCGGCYFACGEGEQCRDSLCGCRAGLRDCGEGCVDTDSDVESCGDCGVICEGATPYCFAGSCTATQCEDQLPTAEGCGADERSCVSVVDLQSSPLHCGDCDHCCEPDQLCLAGSCRSFYPAAGCDACPCAAACGTNLCCGQQGTTVPICLVGAAACP